VMRSSPGAFLFRRMFMIFWIVSGVVNRLDLVVVMLFSELAWAVTSGRSGPGLGWN